MFHLSQMGAYAKKADQLYYKVIRTFIALNLTPLVFFFTLNVKQANRIEFFFLNIEV